MSATKPMESTYGSLSFGVKHPEEERVLTRRELAQEISRKAGVSQRVAHQAINVILTVMREAFRSEMGGLRFNTVELRGFGRFFTDLCYGRSFRCAFLRRQVAGPWKIEVRFRPGRGMREQVSGVPDSSHRTRPNTAPRKLLGREP